MCGIVGYTGNGKASRILLDGLKKLEYRGYDSAGIAVINNGEIFIKKAVGRIENLIEATDGGRNMPGNVGIGHTRWATHGLPSVENAHPHISSDGKFALVHNGIIENYATLCDELVAEGYVFKSNTDTEVIVHLLHKYYSGDVINAIIRTCEHLEGSYAIGIACEDFPDKLYAVCKSAPLIIGVGEQCNYFASDIIPLAEHTKKVIYLGDCEIAEVSNDKIMICDFDGRNIDKNVEAVAVEAYETGLCGYRHFMMKEIMEQQAAMERAMNGRIVNNKINFDNDGLKNFDFANIRRIIIAGCGSAYYAGCAAAYTIEELCNIPVTTKLSSELRYNSRFVGDDALVIALSQSGETADTIAAVKECRSRNAKVISVINVEESTLSKLSDFTLYTRAGPEIAVATTKGYTTQLIVLYMLAVYMADKLCRINADEYTILTDKLKMLPHNVGCALKLNSQTEKIAFAYYGAKSMFFIGRNTDWAVAMEGALKMKEISYIHAESFAAGELKHGSLALVGEDTPVVALCCNERLFEKTVSNIAEVRARGADVVVITTQGNEPHREQTGNIIAIPAVDNLFSAVVEVIPLQLLAYNIAELKKCDIDKPKNLAKSVTVE